MHDKWLARLAVAASAFSIMATADPAFAQSQPAAKPAPAKPAPAKPAAAKPAPYGGSIDITWDDLWPEGEDQRLEKLYNAYMASLNVKGAEGIEEGGDLDKMPQIGSFTTVDSLNNTKVRLPGYIVPLDFNAKDQHTAFLLVPYFGACIHTPPPPPNQIVYVQAKPPVTIKDVWAPVWVEGVIATRRADTKMADAAYTLTLTKLQPYEQRR